MRAAPPGYGQSSSYSSTQGSPVESTPANTPPVPPVTTPAGTTPSIPESSPATAPGYGQSSFSSINISPTAAATASIPGFAPRNAGSTEISPAQTTAPSAPGYVNQPAAPACTLAPAYGNALGAVGASLPSGSFGKVIPAGAVNSVVGALMGKMHGMLGGNAQLNGALPTGLPSTYVGANGETQPLKFEGGMTVGNILDWCAYLAVHSYDNAGAIGHGVASGEVGGNGNLGSGVSISMGVPGAGISVGGGAGAGMGSGVGGGVGAHVSGGVDANVGAGADTGASLGGGFGADVRKRVHPRALRV